MRIDKYIWHVRLSKTRSLAAKLVDGNKIKINSKECKPSKEVYVGDLISVQKNNAVFSYKILQLTTKRLGAKLVIDHLLDLTPEEELEKHKTYQMAQRAYRGKDQGKPNKKDRRDIDHFLEGW
ncbi:MAG: RNA-binding S4 domain-containing protein [Crocinitomicaceae bacterium]|nr:RNA-binding S4 domain-containing protein [Crocinitomicaceae bacterium]